MPQISIICTTFNRKESLKRSIDSILAQSFKDYELIVIDDFSNYDFDAFIKSFNDPRIRSFRNASNGIVAINRNVGIRHARGSYLSFCDDDDFWNENKLERQIEVIKRLNCDLVYSNYWHFTDKPSRKSRNKEISSLESNILSNQVGLSTVLVKNRDILFDEDPFLASIEDYALWQNLLSQGKVFAMLKECLVFYQLSNSSYLREQKKNSHAKLIYFHAKFLLMNKELKTYAIVLLLSAIFINGLKYLIKTLLKL